MKVIISYSEVAMYAMRYISVPLEFNPTDSKTVEVQCNPGDLIPIISIPSILFSALPSVSVRLRIERVQEHRVCLSYDCGPVVSLAIKAVVKKFGNRIPPFLHVDCERKQLILTLDDIPDGEKVLSYATLQDIRFAGQGVEIYAGLK